MGYRMGLLDFISAKPQQDQQKEIKQQDQEKEIKRLKSENVRLNRYAENLTNKYIGARSDKQQFLDLREIVTNQRLELHRLLKRLVRYEATETKLWRWHFALRRELIKRGVNGDGMDKILKESENVD